MPMRVPGSRQRWPVGRIARGLVLLALAWSSAGWAALETVPPAARAAALLAERSGLQAALRSSVFGEPLLLTSRPSPEGEERDEGEVVGEVAQPFARVAEVFGSPATVCKLLFLHLNVRGCKPGPATGAPSLAISAGPMRETMPGLVYGLDFVLRTEQVDGAYIDVRFDAAQGPLGTSHIRVQLEAVPIDAGHSFIRLRFAHDASLAARLASRLYLATAGRAKIGFTVLDRAADGQPRYIGGQRAALERNVMRHYLGLLAYTSVNTGTEPERMEARLRAWHALTERHALQLHELDLADYLHEKHGALARGTE
jgi:hypothetical protein